MNVQSKKPWYLRPIGFIAAIFFFPLFILWYLWIVSLRPTWQKISLSVLSALMMLFYLGMFVGSPPDNFKEYTDFETVGYATETVDDSNLEEGTTKVIQEGREGKKAVTYRVLISGGVEEERERVGEVIVEQPAAKRIAKGTKVAAVVTPATTPTPQAPPAPVTQQPATQPKAQAPAGNCDPNYSPCVPNVSYDLDCADIGFSVTVIGVDKHRFDGNNDGYGCESY